jgi:hypothetical protein
MRAMFPDSEHRNNEPFMRAWSRNTRQARRVLAGAGARLAAVGAALVLTAAGSSAAANVEPPLVPPAAPAPEKLLRNAQPAAPPSKPAWRVPRFWQRLAQCETGGRWDWGRLASSPDRRHLEGTSFEGGLGFAATTWQAWAGAVHVLDEYPRAWMAPPRVQVRVGAYGLRRGGSWGCLDYAYG